MNNILMNDAEDLMICFDDNLSKNRSIELNRYFNKIFSNEKLGKFINKEFIFNLKRKDILNTMNRNLKEGINDKCFSMNDFKSYLISIMNENLDMLCDTDFFFSCHRKNGKNINFNDKEIDTIYVDKDKDGIDRIPNNEMQVIIFDSIANSIDCLQQSKETFLIFFLQSFAERFMNAEQDRIELALKQEN